MLGTSTSQQLSQPPACSSMRCTGLLPLSVDAFHNQLTLVHPPPAGIFVYNTWLKEVRLRPLLLWGSLLGCLVGLTPLMLVEGVNRKLGISDKVFALVDSALLTSIGQVCQRQLPCSCPLLLTAGR